MKEIIENRRIKYLVHFTRIENLESIMKNGLISRAALNNMHLDYKHTDEERFDKCEDAICLSIEFPNYKMFYDKRKVYSESDWVVLFLDASILYEMDCAFCETNAGSAEIYMKDINLRKGKKAFENMFCEEYHNISRNDLNIPDNYPTNPQAEVLVFDEIPVEYIKCVCFSNVWDKMEYGNCIPWGVDSEVNNEFFKYRCDYEFWKKRGVMIGW